MRVRLTSALAGLIGACLVASALGAGERPSHLRVHASLAPAAELIRPLGLGESPIKGLDASAERELLAAVEGAGLRERVLRVAVAAEGGAAVALIKVQAGDAQSRLFALEHVEEDAARALQAAFALPRQLRHVDFWSVIPDDGEDGKRRHRPVFSVAAQRELYLQLMKGRSRSARELLAGLSAVRYDPVFTEHAIDWAVAREQMPRRAYTARRLADRWSALVSEGLARIAGESAAPRTVRVILGGVPNGNKVALTIDDGPRPLITPLLLAILRRENVKATFFVVGEKAEEYPGLVREIERDGHELANHAFSNRRFSALHPEDVYAELRGCSKILSALTGKIVRYMRPPGGDYDEASLQVAERLGLITALWTHNTGDWAEREPATIAFHATHELGPGDIILMHQAGMSSVHALPMIIKRVRARRLEPARLSDVSHNGAVRQMRPREVVALRPRLCLTQ